MPQKWFWWAGRDEEEYCLAGPCQTREQAIDEAYGDTDPGDIIYLVEAVSAPEEERDGDSGIIPFVKTRKRSHVIRKKDAPVKRKKAAYTPKATPSEGRGGEEDKLTMTMTMTISLSEREQEALEKLMAEQDLSKPQVLKCALREYQMGHERRKAGETVSWSGDAQRMRDFAGGLSGGWVPPIDPLLSRAFEVVHHDDGCPSIGGNGDADCKCDAVPFLRDLETRLAALSRGGVSLPDREVQ